MRCGSAVIGNGFILPFPPAFVHLNFCQRLFFCGDSRPRREERGIFPALAVALAPRACYDAAMQSIIHRHSTAPAMQELTREWYGSAVAAPVRYSFRTDGTSLIFRAEQNAPVLLPPYAEPGVFTEKLWMYDLAEFFIASADGSRYLEFNLCPNGAWWACAFSAPRVAMENAPAMQGITAQGSVTPGGWSAEAALPLSLLAELGLSVENCRLAATAVLNSPNYLYLTTAEDLSGEPDFHRPHAWPAAALA